MEVTPALAAAVETGIVAREKRARVDGRRKAGTRKAREEEGFRERMGESAERMRMMVELLKERRRKADVGRERLERLQRQARKMAKEGGDENDREALEGFWEKQEVEG